jgi:hypothetical protein
LTTVSIIHTFLGLVLDMCVPGTGKRRAPRPAAPPPALRPEGALAARLWPPVPRSAYGLDGPLDGTASPLVRPYLVAAERERARQHRRRLALVLAPDFGIDLDQHLVGAESAA